MENNINTTSQEQPSATYRLEMRGMAKSFPGVKALDDVSIKVKPGTVHALMGENGAGKSTLMKCLFGIYHPDQGVIYLDGEKVTIPDPLTALNMGISMVHQELQPIPDRSIAENIFTGRYITKGFGPFRITDDKKMIENSKQWLEQVHLDVDPKSKLGELSISQMQSVEIAKAVSVGAKVLIMDEPTSSLTENEVEDLFKVISNLRKQGVSIIYISHKMEEILEISDEVTIMRDGKYIGTWDAKELTTNFIISKMVGRDLDNVYPLKTNHPGEVVLQVENYTSIHKKSFQNINFDLRKGEILGFAGLVGAQRTELVEAMFGVRRITAGNIIYKGEKLHITNPKQAIDNHMGLITEDRRESGIFGVLSITDNIIIASLDDYKRGPFLDNKKIATLVEDSIEQLQIKTPSAATQIRSLSGGNQQKVIISRWLAKDPDILIMDEPTRGIDVGAKYEIYQIMLDLANQGKSVIMISSEMSELLGVTDRIVVMAAGKLTKILETKETNQEEIMSFATQFS